MRAGVASFLFIAIGIGILIARRFRKVVLPIVFIAVGTFLILGNLDVDAGRFWPVILIVVGVGIIFGGRKSSKQEQTRKTDVSIGESYSTTTDGEVHITCTLGEAKERVESQSFSGGNVNVTMGNVNLDLRSATIENPPARLDASMTMGGLHIRVPSDWVVEIDMNVTMGEAQDKRDKREGASSDPHLVITGNMTMGSLEIQD